MTRTTEPLTKFVPFTVKVKAALPAVALVGERLVMPGTGLFTVKFEAAEVPPPGAGFTTFTERVPAVATSLAVMLAVSCVALTKVVVRLLPFTCTTDVLTKLPPFTVKVKAAPPAVALAGERLVIVGDGLLIVKVAAAEAPALGAGLATVMESVPADAMSPAGILAVSCVALTKVVVRLEPLTLTVAPLTKFVPFTVKVKAAPPTIALPGERLVMVGLGLLTVSVVVAVPPPGAAFTAVMGMAPAVAVSLARMETFTCVGLT